MDLSQIDLAKASHYLNAIPAGFEDISVTNVATAHDLMALGLGGKRVFMLAIGAAVTVLQGDHESTMTNGQGLVVSTSAFSDRFFVPTSTAYEITVIAGSAGPHTLRVFYGD